MKWFYRSGSQEVGPIDTVDLKNLVNRGDLGPSDLVWHTEANGWMRVAQARKLLIGSAGKKSDPSAFDRGDKTEEAPSDIPSDTVVAEAPNASPDEDVSAAESTPEPDTEIDQEATSDSGPNIADLVEHRANAQPIDVGLPSPLASLEPTSSQNDDDVTAGIVNRLRRRMEEITGEKMITQADAAEQEEKSEKASETASPREIATPPETASAPETNSPADETSADADADNRKPPPLPPLGVSADKDDETVSDEPSPKAETPEENFKANPDSKKASVTKAKSRPKTPITVVAATDTADNKKTDTESPSSDASAKDGAKDAPAKDASAKNGGVQNKSTSAKDAAVVAADSAVEKPEINDNQANDAPAKQVATPVRTNRLPPRALIADFRPAESTIGTEKKTARNRKERLVPAKRLTKNQPRPTRASLKKPTTSTNREQPPTQTPTPTPPSRIAAATPPPLPAGNQLPDDQPSQASPAPVLRPPPLPPRRAVGVESPPPVEATGPNTPEPIAAPTSLRIAAMGVSSNQSAMPPPDKPNTRPHTQSGPNVEPGTSVESGPGAQSGNEQPKSVGRPKSPRDLARAASEALRRERSRSADAKAGDDDKKVADRPVQDARSGNEPGGRIGKRARPARIDPEWNNTPPVGQSGGANDSRSARYPTRTPAANSQPIAEVEDRSNLTVEPLIQPVSGAETSGSMLEQRSDFTQSAASGGLPQSRPPQTGTANESSAVRSLPGRTGATRKKGAAKSRRRDGSNMVPMSRQALSARNESARSRHALGRYSLVRSYWINLVLGTLLLFGAGGLGIWYLADHARVFHLVGLAAILAILIVVIAPWQIAGVWRSANEHIRQRDGSIVARVAQASLLVFVAGYVALLAVLIVPVAAAASLLLQADDERAFKVRLNAAGTTIQVDGLIEPGLTAQIDETLRRSPRVRTLVLNSAGGYLFEARRLRDLIETSPISATYTRTQCKGACVLPFMAADERGAEVGSVLQFGGPTGASGPLGLVDERLGLAADVRYLVERGIDPVAFDIGGMAGYNSSDRHVDLIETGTLTAVSVGNKVFRKGNLDSVTNAQVERALLTVPFFDTIRRVEPDLFAAFRDGVAAASLDSVDTDGLGDRTFDSASPLIEHVKAAYLPSAPDRSTDDLMAVLTALGDDLQAVNPAACVALISPSLDTLGRPVAPFLEADSRAGYFQVFDRVIATAGRDPQTPADPSVATEISTPVIAELAGDDTAVGDFLTNGVADGLSVEAQCDAALQYFTALRAMPLAERAIAFRQFAVR